MKQEALKASKEAAASGRSPQTLSLRYRGDICGVALFLPPLFILPGLLGSWMGKGATVCALHPCLPSLPKGRGGQGGCSAPGHGVRRSHHRRCRSFPSPAVLARGSFPTPPARCSPIKARFWFLRGKRAARASSTRVSPASPDRWPDPVEMPRVSVLLPVEEWVFGASSTLCFGNPWHSPIPVGETGREGAEAALLPARLYPAASS